MGYADLNMDVLTYRSEATDDEASEGPKDIEFISERPETAPDVEPSTSYEGGISNPKGLSEEKIQEYRNVFQLIDKDGSNSISFEELKTILKSIGKNPTDEEVKEMIASVDEDGNGEIDFDEFIEMMENDEKAFTSEKLMREAFDVMDPDGNGYVTLANLKNVIASTGFDFTHEEIEEMIEEADPQNDGKIEYAGLIGLMSEENESLMKAYEKRVVIEENEKEEAQRREAERVRLEEESKTTQTGIPDLAEIASQYDNEQYDKYSRKVSKNGIVAKRSNKTVPMTRTRMLYLQRKNKLNGIDGCIESDFTGSTVSFNNQSQSIRSGYLTESNQDFGSQQVNRIAQDDRGSHDRKTSPNSTRLAKPVDRRLLNPNYYLKKPKDSSKANSMHLGHIQSISDDFQQELRKLRASKGYPNGDTQRSESMNAKASAKTTNGQLPKATNGAKHQSQSYVQHSMLKSVSIGAKLYTALWRRAFAKALETLQVNKKGVVHLCTPDLIDDRLKKNELHLSYKQVENRGQKQAQRGVPIIVPFLEGPPKNVVKENKPKQQTSNSGVNKSRKVQAPVNKIEKYHRDFLKPNLLPKIQANQKRREVITKSALNRMINL